MYKIVIARNDEKTYNKYIKKSLENIDVDAYELEDDENEKLSLTQKYNYAIENILEEDNFNEEDFIIFCHEDVEILDKYFKEKIKFTFDGDEDIGLLGVIGSKQFNETGMWWANQPKHLAGHIIQVINDKDNHLVKGKIGYHKDVVALDGLILITKAKFLKEGFRFDENFDFDMYDIDFCFQFIEKNYYIVISDILVKHESQGFGALTDKWKKNKDKLIKKYKNKGWKFPVKKD